MGRYFFEKMSRKYKDPEIKDFFLANFVNTDNPEGLWIGNIIRSGEGVYKEWQKRQQEDADGEMRSIKEDGPEEER